MDGSLAECEAEKHYMNGVCIERTKRLERFVLEIKMEEFLGHPLIEKQKWTYDAERKLYGGLRIRNTDSNDERMRI